MPSHPLDGSLGPWQDIADHHEWKVLLAGNGLSINVWPPFGYGSLFQHVHGGGLTQADLPLFADTPNFERVLGELRTAIRLSLLSGVDPTPFYDRYYRIQRALGHAIRQVHLTRSEAPNATLEAIRAALLGCEWIFTTSYDLIIYWSMGRGPGGTWEPFMDHFRWGGRCQFDASRSDVEAGKVPVYFLHGALHLVVGGTGVTRKITQTAVQTLLDQFGQVNPEDPEARPLLVTEGSARDKLQAIEGNDYLSHSLDTFRARDQPLVVFGSRLGPEDQHLIEAINAHRDRPVAVSLYPGSRRTLAPIQGDIFGRLVTDTLLFFDSTTHPLGTASLSAVL